MKIGVDFVWTILPELTYYTIYLWGVYKRFHDFFTAPVIFVNRFLITTKIIVPAKVDKPVAKLLYFKITNIFYFIDNKIQQPLVFKQIGFSSLIKKKKKKAYVDRHKTFW